jgi:hypothetical protein
MISSRLGAIVGEHFPVRESSGVPDDDTVAPARESGFRLALPFLSSCYRAYQGEHLPVIRSSAASTTPPKRLE